MANKINVLFLPKWYSCRNRPLTGIFIKRHGEVLKSYCNVLVLYPVSDESLKSKWLDFQYSSEEGLETLRIYYRKKITGLNLFDHFLRLILYIIALFKGYFFMRKKYKKIDLVHVHVLLRPVILAWYLKIFKKTPYLIGEHWTGYLPSDGTYKKQSFLRKYLCRLAVKNCTHITPDSTDLGEWMRRHGLLSEYTTIPNVVDTDIFKSYYPDKNIRKKRIIHISSLNDQQKNVSGIIEAVKQLAQYRQDFELLIIGTGYDYLMLKEKAAKENLLDSIIYFIGGKYKEELARILSSGDFLILFSNYENQPCVIGESWACEVPVLVTSVGDIPNIVTAELGRMIEPGNVKKLTEEINFLLDHSNEFNKYLLRKHAVENYSNQAVGNKLFEVYKSVLKLS